MYDASGPAPPLPFDLKTFSEPQMLVVRVYILEGIDLTPKDIGGSSDPYLRLKLGHHEFNDVKNKHKATLQPQFYKCFEFENVKFPEETDLEIEVWDWYYSTIFFLFKCNRKN